MKSMRVAIGSDDGEVIIPDHMGEAKDFYIFDFSEDGRSVLVEKRPNTSPEETDESGHGSVRKLKSASAIFGDCDVVLGRRGSPNFIRMRDNTKFQPVVTRIDSISGTMQELGRSFSDTYALVERRRHGERPKEIPIIRPREEMA
ncbi:MAG: hypothetical protein J7M39_04785 [Anaerolineae bacterium]|nr:hypothetical protein [Anaerolineae bacterium]